MKKSLIKEIDQLSLACWLKNAHEHPRGVKKIIIWYDSRDNKYYPQNLLNDEDIEKTFNEERDSRITYIGIIDVEKETFPYLDIIDIEVKKYNESHKLVQT